MIPSNLHTGPSRLERRSEPSGFRKIVRKTALLNAVILATSFPVLAWFGGPRVIGWVVAIMAGVSLLLWASTFALYSLSTLPGLFREPARPGKPVGPPNAADAGGVADRWLDGPG
jgi:hypothetical protein